MSRTINGVELSNRTISYLETVLWSETVSLPCAENQLVDGCMDVDEDNPLHGISDSSALDEHFDISDFTAESLCIAEKDVTDWFNRMEELGLYDLASEYAGDDSIAHDFWLTRNGHGCGYFDGDYEDEIGQRDSVGDRLTEACKAFGERNVYVGDDCKLHFS